MQMYRIHLNDELRKIGSGHRTVLIKEGRVWITVFDWTTLRHQRIKKSAWAALNPVLTANGPGDRRVIRKAIRSRLRYQDRTKLIKEALS
jgi:hypothetical protein